ncbi:hypothetical protein GINT2_002046 [Glugoides intestinalis]
MRECEEYFEEEDKKLQTHIIDDQAFNLSYITDNATDFSLIFDVTKETFSFPSDKIEENTEESETSSKRYKSCSSRNSSHSFYQNNSTIIPEDLIVSGFKTAKNEDILVSKAQIEEAAKKTDFSNTKEFLESFLSSLAETSDEAEAFPEIVSKCESEAYQETKIGYMADVNAKVNEKQIIESGFTTGKNKAILINTANIKSDIITQEPENETGKLGDTWLASVENKLKRILDSNPESKEVNSETVKLDRQVEEVYERIVEHFKKEEKAWVFQQFKWSWLHLYLNSDIEKSTLFEEIIEIMNLRLKYEKSILRQIVEFDNVPFRLMVLGVIDYTEDTIELYDGFYSLQFQIDKSIYLLLTSNKCTLGTKLCVFGASILLKEPTSIFDVQGVAMKLTYNGVKICQNDLKLGESGKIAFLNTIGALKPDGGIVSALVVRIKKILEVKYLVTIENYKNRVDDLEKEIEKILKIAEKTGHTLKVEDIKVRRYSKIVIEDDTGECQLTWWLPPELKVSDQYKLVFLNAVGEYFGLQLSTTKSTYFEKLTNK